jgi:peptide methionine sulfoxide reductase MsrA
MTEPVQRACIWNVDTGAAFKGPLTIMDIDTKDFWQSEPLHQLYFEERDEYTIVVVLKIIFNFQEQCGKAQKRQF